MLHNLAIVRHLRHDVAWAVAPRAAALAAWLDDGGAAGAAGAAQGPGPTRFAAALRPALLSGDALLVALERAATAAGGGAAPSRARLREALRLLLLVSAGVPLLVVLILAAL